MSTITITITGDTPASVSLLTLKRSDTSADVTVTPALPQDMTDAGGGAWTFAFTEPATGLTYDYTFRVTWADASFYEDAGSFTGAAQPSATYGNLSDLTGRFGVTNIFQWADLDNVGESAWATNALVLARIQSALDWADAEINRFFYGSIYTIPFTPVVPCLAEWAALIAGTRLFNGRGQRDKDGGPAADYSSMLQLTYEEMGQVRGGYPFQIRGVTLNSGTAIATTIVDQFANTLSTAANLAPTGQTR